MIYRTEIDGLRALAVVPVVLFHAGFDFFSGGFVGVDIFFVISGYLITSLILYEIEEKKFSLINFYKRRVRRLLPSLLVVMIVSLPFAWFFLAPRDLKDFGQSLVGVSTFSSNFLFWWESGYFEQVAELKPLLHTWSLALEEQFYIVFPLFLLLVWRLGRTWILIILLCFFLISLGLSEWLVRKVEDPKLISAAFYMLPTRGWEFLIGIFVAFYLKSKGHVPSHLLNQVISILGVGMIIYSIIYFNKNTPFPSFYTLIPTLGTALLIIGSINGTLIYKLLTNKFLVGVGLVSYSTYLWHQPLLAFTRYTFLNEVSDFLLIFICLSSLCLGWISYHYVEAPFRDRSKTSTSFLMTFVAIGTLTLSSLGLVIHFNDGFKSRVDYGNKLSTLEKSPLRRECHSVKEPCEFFEDKISLATFGDSHVVELSYALAEYFLPFGYGIQQNSYSGCPPNISSPEKYCKEWTLNAIERINSDKRIKGVIIGYYLSYYLSENNTEQDSQWNDLLQIMNKFSSAGKKVFFLLQPPTLKVAIDRQVLLNGPNEVIGLTRKKWIQKNNYVLNRLHELPQETIILDSMKILCDNTVCFSGDEDGYYYFDEHHLSLHGARKVVNEIAQNNEIVKLIFNNEQ